MEIQSGVATVGSNMESLLLKEFQITFPQEFNSEPVLVANTLEQANTKPHVNDTFAVSVKSTTTKDAIVHIRRVDGGTHWAQPLRLNWIAIAQ